MTSGSFLPDPWLLLAKSAINYIHSNKHKGMLACEPVDSDEDCANETHTTPILSTNDGAALGGVFVFLSLSHKQ